MYLSRLLATKGVNNITVAEKIMVFLSNYWREGYNIWCRTSLLYMESNEYFWEGGCTSCEETLLGIYQ